MRGETETVRPTFVWCPPFFWPRNVGTAAASQRFKGAGQACGLSIGLSAAPHTACRQGRPHLPAPVRLLGRRAERCVAAVPLPTEGGGGPIPGNASAAGGGRAVQGRPARGSRLKTKRRRFGTAVHSPHQPPNPGFKMWHQTHTHLGVEGVWDPGGGGRHQPTKTPSGVAPPRGGGEVQN